jgi:SynChlorMet cassette protein ScmC
MNRYCFRLADGKGWQFMGASADRDVSLFVDRFAGIAGLRASAEEGFRKIFFLHTDEVRQMKNGPHVADCGWALDETNGGWVVYDHKSLKIWCHESIPEIICEICDHSTHDTEIMNMWHALQPIFQQAQKTGGLPIHGALLELEGKGVIIAASGDTGKSTCCRRIPGYWKPLCDDELLVIFDKENGYRAHPFPTWSDYLWRNSEKTWDVAYSVPLQAIFFLEQAQTDEAKPVGNGQAAILMKQSAMQVCHKFWRTVDKEHRRELTQQLFGNACEMAKTIPAYTLKATLEGRFWEEIERHLNHGKTHHSRTGPLS